MATTYGAWKMKQSEVYDEPPSPVDPRDEAYSEACEEIDRLKKVIERLEQEAKLNAKGQDRGA